MLISSSFLRQEISLHRLLLSWYLKWQLLSSRWQMKQKVLFKMAVCFLVHILWWMSSFAPGWIVTTFSKWLQIFMTNKKFICFIPSPTLKFEEKYPVFTEFTIPFSQFLSPFFVFCLWKTICAINFLQWYSRQFLLLTVCCVIEFNFSWLYNSPVNEILCFILLFDILGHFRVFKCPDPTVQHLSPGPPLSWPSSSFWYTCHVINK